MPTLLEIQRKEPDPFGEDRHEEGQPNSAFATSAEQSEAQARRAEGAHGPALERPVQAEAVAPHLLAELPQQSEVPKETLTRLFVHLAQKDEGGDEETDMRVVAQPDPRQTSRDLVPHYIEVGDSIRDGMAADFIHDSAIAAADLDTPPGPADWDGWAERRKRIQIRGTPLRKEEAATGLAPETAAATETKTK